MTLDVPFGFQTTEDTYQGARPQMNSLADLRGGDGLILDHLEQTDELRPGETIPGVQASRMNIECLNDPANRTQNSLIVGLFY